MTMRRIDLQPLEPFTSDFIDRTGAFNPGALEAATAIIEQVRQEGDGALRALTEKFDGVAIENFRVPGEAIDAAMAEVDPDTLEALKHAAAQIRDFHERQKQQSWFFAREDGAIVGSKVTPLESVGIYVPGGRALYPSTVLMNALPAQVAGVERIVCVTPPTKDGTLDAAILAACKIAGVTEIYTADNGVGTIITSSDKGYSSTVVVMVAFDPDGTIKQVKIQSQGETAGVGTKIENESFWSQYTGLPAETITLDQQVDRITGASISSSAVNDAVNFAIAAYNAIS